MRLIRTVAPAAVLALTVSACGGNGNAATNADLPPLPGVPAPAAPQEPAAPEPAAEDQAAAAPKVAGTVATGLDAPWGLAFLSNGEALVSERDSGLIQRVNANGELRRAGEVPGVRPGGEGGLLGIVLGPSTADVPILYAYFTAANDNRIVRFELRNDELRKPEVILDGIPKASIHNGGRMVFGPDGMLYVGTGDAGVQNASQDPDSLGGKILRMTPEGEAPDDNPTAGSLVYSLGHRNVQGLAFDDRNRLWAAEFGQNTFDELNLIEAGNNYGWPEVEGTGGGSKFTDPERTWSTDEASPSGIAVWEGSVWMAGLRGSRLWQIPLTGENADRPTQAPKDHFRDEYGRLRTVAQAPDGSLWLITSNTDGRGDVQNGDDRILRLTLG